MGSIVIGAGIAGLVAAHELVKAGVETTIIEPGPIGGMIHTESTGGFTLECGPNVLVERPELLDLLRELGLEGEIRYPSVMPYGQYVWHEGEPCLVPKSLMQLAKSPLFSWGFKVSLPLKLLKRGLLKPVAEDESVLQFFSRLLGERTTKILLDPVLKGIYGGNVEDLSARSIFPKLWDAASAGKSLAQYMKERKGAGAPRTVVINGGMQTVTDTLWERLSGKVRVVAAAASTLSPLGGGGYKVTTTKGEEITGERVVVTASGKRLVRLTETLEPQTAELMRTTPYATLAVVHLAVPRTEPLIPKAFGVLFPRGMPEHFLGVMFNSIIFPHVAPPDKHVLTVVLGGAQAGKFSPSEEVLTKNIPRLVEKLMKLPMTEWLGAATWPDAIPQLNVGHFRTVAAIDSFEEKFPGVVVASVDRGGVGVSDRIRLAREAVGRLHI
jgi:oxygen-dependent protoporphyrinogen oxidase